MSTQRKATPAASGTSNDQAKGQEKPQSPQMQHDQTGEFDYGPEGGQSQQHGLDSPHGTDRAAKRPQAGQESPLPLNSANSSDADPDARHRALRDPVPSVTRHI